MAAESLGTLILDVLQSGQDKSLNEEEKESFYKAFYEQVAPQIDEIRATQRKAFEESRNLTLA